ncbi:MAG: triacylglycerol lipase [Oscillospiraceae bacterium]|nr:triacylglycerol lipase [Oscillospiraceae bacterium]
MENNNGKTKYPLLLLHGVGFRDLKWPLYWGRIPNALSGAGAELFYGNQDCWARVEDNAKTIKARIRQILEETGAEKINIIAHSKGGLEARMAASSLGMGGHIASITTIGTPHRGSKTIDRLLKAPDSLFNIAAFAVDNWIGLIGDTKPDFYAVCRDFSTSYAQRFNEENPDVPGVYYQSFAGVMKTPLSDIHLSTANIIVKMIEGDNDGLVSVDSAKWGESFTLLTGRTNRGVSHYDEIDFRRAPLSAKQGRAGVADICDVYKEIVKGLADRGF